MNSIDWSKCVQNTTVTDANGQSHTEQIATVGCIPVLLANLIIAAFAFAGSVAVIIIIFAGIKFIRSQGNPQALQSARQTIIWGIIGLLIVIFAFTVVTFIGSITGTIKLCMFQALFNANISTQLNPCQ